MRRPRSLSVNRFNRRGAGGLRFERTERQPKTETMSDKTPQPIDDRWPHDLQAERSMLALIVQCGVDLFDKLDAQDFFDPVHRFLFEELRMMTETGEPLSSKVALGRWFTSSRVRARCASKCDVAPVDLPGVIAEVFGEFVSGAHEAYLLAVLKRERVRRGKMRIGKEMIADALTERVDVMAGIDRSRDQLDKLWEVAAESLAKGKATA